MKEIIAYIPESSESLMGDEAAIKKDALKCEKLQCRINGLTSLGRAIVVSKFDRANGGLQYGVESAINYAEKLADTVMAIIENECQRGRWKTLDADPWYCMDFKKSVYGKLQYGEWYNRDFNRVYQEYTRSCIRIDVKGFSHTEIFPCEGDFEKNKVKLPQIIAWVNENRLLAMLTLSQHYGSTPMRLDQLIRNCGLARKQEEFIRNAYENNSDFKIRFLPEWEKR